METKSSLYLYLLPAHFQVAVCFFILATGVNGLYAQIQISGNLHIGDHGVMHIAYADTYFDRPQITSERSEDYGVLSFSPDGQVINEDHNAFVNGVVRHYGTENEVFVIGNEAIYQPLLIRNRDTSLPLDVAFLNSPHAHTNLSPDLRQISNRFHWPVYQAHGNAQLTLSWNAFSRIDELTLGALEALTIAGFNGAEWEQIASEINTVNSFTNESVSTLSGSIESVSTVNLDSYSAFTLARKSGAAIIINVSEGFTPNGDGINDTWFLENVEHYPNIKIKIFNRWQRVVFSHQGPYQNDWPGTYRGQPLPDAPYFYTIDREGNGSVDQSGWIYITQ